MGRGIAGDALDLAGQVEEAMDALVRLVQVAQRRGHGDRLIEPDAELVRHHLRDAVDLAVAETEHATHVADGRPREHRPERDDLGDPVAAVLARDVGDDLVPAGVLEVDVDVRHGHAAGVQEALERQLIADGIDRRDA